MAEVDDPYGLATASELSLFRRPMPTTNLKFISAVMWDGRETTFDPSSSDCIYGTTTCFSPIPFDLSTQANHATLGHACQSALKIVHLTASNNIQIFCKVILF